MGKVNQLFQDDRERRIKEYLAEHPEADEQIAYEALFAREDEAPE